VHVKVCIIYLAIYTESYTDITEYSGFFVSWILCALEDVELSLGLLNGGNILGISCIDIPDVVGS